MSVWLKYVFASAILLSSLLLSTTAFSTSPFNAVVRDFSAAATSDSVAFGFAATFSASVIAVFRTVKLLLS